MEWIKVEDKQPEQGEYVLCVYKHYMPFIGYYTGEWGRFKCVDDPDGTFNISHWMPLPESPL